MIDIANLLGVDPSATPKVVNLPLQDSPGIQKILDKFWELNSFNRSAIQALNTATVVQEQRKAKAKQKEIVELFYTLFNDTYAEEETKKPEPSLVRDYTELYVALRGKLQYVLLDKIRPDLGADAMELESGVNVNLKTGGVGEAPSL